MELRGATAVWAIVARDLRVELRGRELLPALVQFIVLALVVANFAFAIQGRQQVLQIVPGILWMVLVFVGIVAFTRAFAGERDQGTLDAMLLTRASPAMILLGKTLAQAALLTATELVLLPATALFLQLPLTPEIFLIVFLAIIGMASLGALFSALATQTRARELLLPVLAVPLWIPFVVVGSGLVDEALQRASIDLAPVLLLCYMDILFLVIAAAVARFVLDD